jgi:hypothetical protein
VWFAFSFFAALLTADLAAERKWNRIGIPDTLKLLGLGCATCATTIFYTFAMSTLPVPLALTLLFQFTWIGTVIQVVMTRRAPAACQVVSALVIVAGTVFASGLYATNLSICNPWGIAAGLAAAVCASRRPDCHHGRSGRIHRSRRMGRRFRHPARRVHNAAAVVTLHQTQGAECLIRLNANEPLVGRIYPQMGHTVPDDSPDVEL